MWLLFVLIPIAIVAYAVWTYQQKRRESEAAQEERFKALFGATSPNKTPAPTTSSAETPASAITPTMAAAIAAASLAPATKTPASTSVITPAAAASIAYTRKPRLFQQRHALLYYVLRTGLPDHEIFADHALADFIEVAGAGNEEPALQQLQTQRVDFIVCNKQMEVIAAIIVGSGSTFARNALQAANVRIVLVNPDDLPKHAQVRDLIYG